MPVTLSPVVAQHVLKCPCESESQTESLTTSVLVAPGDVDLHNICGMSVTVGHKIVGKAFRALDQCLGQWDERLRIRIVIDVYHQLSTDERHINFSWVDLY